MAEIQTTSMDTLQFQKISTLHPQKQLKFSGGGVLKDKKIKEIKLNWNFQRGGGSFRQKSLL